jgi:hypothetical protein
LRKVAQRLYLSARQQCAATQVPSHKDIAEALV